MFHFGSKTLHEDAEQRRIHRDWLVFILRGIFNYFQERSVRVDVVFTVITETARSFVALVKIETFGKQTLYKIRGVDYSFKIFKSILT